MEKKKWKKCLACDIYTDADENCCPLYGCCQGHELKEVSLFKEEIFNFLQQRKIFTKHMSYMSSLEKRMEKAGLSD